jgi:hypothetical protein
MTSVILTPAPIVYVSCCARDEINDAHTFPLCVCVCLVAPATVNSDDDFDDSAENCQAACEAEPLCLGYEYSANNCELHDAIIDFDHSSQGCSVDAVDCSCYQKIGICATPSPVAAPTAAPVAPPPASCFEQIGEYGCCRTSGGDFGTNTVVEYVLFPSSVHSPDIFPPTQLPIDASLEAGLRAQ